MEVVLSEKIDPAVLMQFEQKYKQEEATGKITDTTKFEYAWCLVRSPYSDDWKTGFQYLEQLYGNGDDLAKRDYLYYMAVAQFKLNNYDRALHFCDVILQVQPQNHQVNQLKKYIEQKVRNKGIAGMAIVGGAGLAIGVGVAVLAALTTTKK